MYTLWTKGWHDIPRCSSISSCRGYGGNSVSRSCSRIPCSVRLQSKRDQTFKYSSPKCLISSAFSWKLNTIPYSIWHTYCFTARGKLWLKFGRGFSAATVNIGGGDQQVEINEAFDCKKWTGVQASPLV